MKKIEIKRKIKYLVIVDGRNELTTSNKKDILNLIETKLKNKDICITINDVKRKNK